MNDPIWGVLDAIVIALFLWLPIEIVEWLRRREQDEICDHCSLHDGHPVSWEDIQRGV